MTQKLRIVHCFRSPVGGIFRHVRDLTRGAGRGRPSGRHRLRFDHRRRIRGAAVRRDEADQLALGVHRTPMQRHIGPGDIAAAWRTYSIIKELQPDVLHGHGAKGGVYARMFGSLLRVSRSRVARLYSPHGGSLHYDETTLTGKLFFAARAADGALHRPPAVRLGLRAARLSPQGRRAARAEQRWSTTACARPSSSRSPAAPDAADFLYIGMMRDLKGPDLFIDALASVETRDRPRRSRAVMVGDGDDLPRYQRAGRSGSASANACASCPPMPARAGLRAWPISSSCRRAPKPCPTSCSRRWPPASR